MVLVVGSPVGFVLLIQRLPVLQKPFEGISHTSLFLIAFSDANCRSIYLSQYYIVTDLFLWTAINEMLPPWNWVSILKKIYFKIFYTRFLVSFQSCQSCFVCRVLEFVFVFLHVRKFEALSKIESAGSTGGLGYQCAMPLADLPRLALPSEKKKRTCRSANNRGPLCTLFFLQHFSITCIKV